MNNGDNSMEEIKLYWTIQIATAGVLGFLGTNLKDLGARSLFVLLIALLLVSIGSIYNLVGNYYVYCCFAKQGKKDYSHEDITPLTILIVYIFITGIIGGFLAISMANVFKITSYRLLFAILGFLIATLTNYIICRKVYSTLIHLSNEWEVSYAQYTKNLSDFLLTNLGKN